MLSAFFLIALAQDPPPVFEPPPPTPQPDTSKLPRPNDHRMAAFVSGEVKIEGEGRLPDKALVELVCPGAPARSVYTLDRFDLPFVSSESTGIAGCAVQASLSGYMPLRRPASIGNMGLLLLKPRPEAKGFSYSATSLLAPPEAQKQYDRGLEFARKNKRTQAREAWESAVRVHPKYATAWLQLGLLHQGEKRMNEARDAYQRAWESDKKYLLPLLHLTALAATERDWKRTVDLSDQLTLLNPVEFPEAYLYNAAGFFNLGHAAPAEQSARRAIELDPMHRHPRSHQLLGMILESRGDKAGAIEQYKLFVQHAGKSPEAVAVRGRIGALETGR